MRRAESISVAYASGPVMSDKRHFEKTVLLSIGHVAVVAAGFLVPVFLSRWLTIEAYGSYKQLILLYSFALLIGHMGMDNGLFYFIKSHPGKEGVFSLNILLFDLGMAVLLAGGCLVFGSDIARLFNNPGLAEFFPVFALFVLFAIPAQHFEHYLAVLDDIKSAIALSVAYEAIKAGVIVGGFYWFGSLHAVILGLALLSLAKLLCLLVFNLRRVRAAEVGWAEMKRFFGEQVAFSLPQGAKNLIGSVLKMDKFVISAMFPVREFTLYAVGCFEVPLIGSVSNTMTDLMSFDMVEARRTDNQGKVKALWHSTIRKVSLFQVPIAVYLFYFAVPIIVFIFSETYRESAAYFRVFLIGLLLTGFSPEILFRVFARTGLVLKLQIIAVAYTVVLVIGGAYQYGPMGALVGKVVSDAMTLALYSHFAGELMGLRLRDYLPWKAIFGIGAVSVFCVLVSCFAWYPLHLHPFPLLIVSAITYVGLVFIVSVRTGLIKDDETAYLKAKIAGLRRSLP